ncbi:MAG: PQQ-binding-like beta-propeller repeat protein [Actinobacteria bacterium]|nr:PQQ-binding-like beta-propeller repeat protein [Actinomycetota bacterium]
MQKSTSDGGGSKRTVGNYRLYDSTAQPSGSKVTTASNILISGVIMSLAPAPSASCTNGGACSNYSKYSSNPFTFRNDAGCLTPACSFYTGGLMYYKFLWKTTSSYDETEWSTASAKKWSDNNNKCPSASCDYTTTSINVNSTEQGATWLHIRSYNGGINSGTQTIGPFYYDTLTSWHYPAAGSAPNAKPFNAAGSLRLIAGKWHYFVSDSGGKLFAIDSSNGNLDWSYDSASAAVTTATPTSFGNFVYLGNGDGKLYKFKDNGTGYSLAQADTGWATNPVSLGDGSDKSIIAIPLIVSISSANRIIVAAGEDLYCINDSDGTNCAIWATNPINLPNAGGAEQITATPTVGTSGTPSDTNYIYVATKKSSSSSQLYKVTKSDGSIAATFATDIGGVNKNISYRYNGAATRLYFNGETTNKVYATDTGINQIWCVGSGCANDPGGLQNFSSGVYPSAFAGAIYVGNNNGKVYRIQGSDGACLWYYNAGSAILGTPVALNSKVYFATQTGYFYIVTDIAGGGCAQNSSTIASYPFSTGDTVFANPTFFLSSSKVIIPSAIGKIFEFTLP